MARLDAMSEVCSAVQRNMMAFPWNTWSSKGHTLQIGTPQKKKDVSVYFFSSLTKHIYSENFPMIQARWTIGQKDEEEEEVKKGGKSSGGSGSAANQAWNVVINNATTSYIDALCWVEVCPSARGFPPRIWRNKKGKYFKSPSRAADRQITRVHPVCYGSENPIGCLVTTSRRAAAWLLFSWRGKNEQVSDSSRVLFRGEKYDRTNFECFFLAHPLIHILLAYKLSVKL